MALPSAAAHGRCPLPPHLPTATAATPLLQAAQLPALAHCALVGAKAGCLLCAARQVASGAAAAAAARAAASVAAVAAARNVAAGAAARVPNLPATSSSSHARSSRKQKCRAWCRRWPPACCPTSAARTACRSRCGPPFAACPTASGAASPRHTAPPQVGQGAVAPGSVGGGMNAAGKFNFVPKEAQQRIGTSCPPACLPGHQRAAPGVDERSRQPPAFLDLGNRLEPGCALPHPPPSLPPFLLQASPSRWRWMSAASRCMCCTSAAWSSGRWMTKASTAWSGGRHRLMPADRLAPEVNCTAPGLCSPAGFCGSHAH